MRQTPGGGHYGTGTGLFGDGGAGGGVDLAAELFHPALEHRLLRLVGVVLFLDRTLVLADLALLLRSLRVGQVLAEPFHDRVVAAVLVVEALLCLRERVAGIGRAALAR